MPEWRRHQAAGGDFKGKRDTKTSIGQWLQQIACGAETVRREAQVEPSGRSKRNAPREDSYPGFGGGRRCYRCSSL
jgi:hypothetical protein